MEQAPKKINKTVLLVIVVAVAAVAATAGFFLLRSAPVAAPAGLTVDGGIVTDDNADMQDLMAEMQRQTDESAVTAEYEPVIAVAAGSSEGKGYIGNPADNLYPVVFTLSVEGEEIYRSGLVPVGNHLETIKLAKTPPAGEHEALLTYHLMDEQTGEEKAKAIFVVTLRVGV